MDEPTADPAIIAAYLVCREASRQSTVLLSGVGGDELFAGYRKYAAHNWAELYGRTPAFLRKQAEAAVSSLPSLRGTSAKGYIRLIKKMMRSAALPPRDRFIQNCTYLDPEQRTSFYTGEVRNQITPGMADCVHQSAFQKIGSSTRFR